MFELFLDMERNFLDRLVSNPLIYTHCLRTNRETIRRAMLSSLVSSYNLDKMPPLVQVMSKIVVEQVIDENFGSSFI